MKTKLTVPAASLWLLSLAILLTIYGMWLLFPLEITWLGLEDKVYLSSQTIQYNFNILMNYLTNPFQWTLVMPDFRSSASGLHHFEVVKYLFHLAHLVFLLTLPSAYFFVKNVVKKGYLSLYKNWFLAWCLVPVVIALLAVLIGFDNFFVLFHQILFTGDNTWMFDPAKDPVILILPEEFFMQAFIVFFALYEVFFISLAVTARWKDSK